MKGKKKKHNGGTSVNSKLLRKPIQRCFLLFLAPTFLAFCIGFIYPFLRGIYLSFCKFVTIGDASFVGLEIIWMHLMMSHLYMHFGIQLCMQ